MESTERLVKQGLRILHCWNEEMMKRKRLNHSFWPYSHGSHSQVFFRSQSRNAVLHTWTILTVRKNIHTTRVLTLSAEELGTMSKLELDRD